MHKYEFKDFARDDEQIIINESVYIPAMLPEHTHNFLELFYILEGRGEQMINGHRIPIREGDLFLLGYNNAHTFLPEQNSDTLKWININLVPEFIDSSLINEYNVHEIVKLSVFRNLFFNKDSITYLQISGVQQSYGPIIYLMLDEYRQHKYGYISCLKHYLIILLTKIFCDNLKEQGASDTRWLLQTVLDELSKSVTEQDSDNISLEKFAQKAFMSAKSFSRLFRQKVGVSFTQYVQQKRIEKSCQMLAETDMPIQAIMLEIGYYDPKTFYNLFKRLMGVTPMQYRNNIRNRPKDS